MISNRRENFVKVPQNTFIKVALGVWENQIENDSIGLADSEFNVCGP